MQEIKELDHKKPIRDGGSDDESNLREVWPTEHGKIDSQRRPGYEVIEVIEGLQ